MDLCRNCICYDTEEKKCVKSSSYKNCCDMCGSKVKLVAILQNGDEICNECCDMIMGDKDNLSAWLA